MGHVRRVVTVFYVMGLLSGVVNALAFPRPAVDREAARCLAAWPSLKWLDDNPQRNPALYIRRPSLHRRSRRFLILYSHGNAEDLCELINTIRAMAVALDADVLAYECTLHSHCTATRADERSQLALHVRPQILATALHQARRAKQDATPRRTRHTDGLYDLNPRVVAAPHRMRLCLTAAASVPGLRAASPVARRRQSEGCCCSRRCSRAPTPPSGAPLHELAPASTSSKILR